MTYTAEPLKVGDRVTVNQETGFVEAGVITGLTNEVVPGEGRTATVHFDDDTYMGGIALFRVTRRRDRRRWAHPEGVAFLDWLLGPVLGPSHRRHKL